MNFPEINSLTFATSEDAKRAERLFSGMQAANKELLECLRTLLSLMPHFPEGSQSAKKVDRACQIVAKAEKV